MDDIKRKLRRRKYYQNEREKIMFESRIDKLEKRVSLLEREKMFEDLY